MSIINHLREFKVVSVDVETTGTHWYKDRMFGVAVAGWDGENTYSDYYDTRDKPGVIDVLKRDLPHVKKLVNHSVKFDSHFLINEGIKVPLDRIECTMVRSALINEHEFQYGLDHLCNKYIGHRKVDIYQELAELFGGRPTREAQMANLHRAPPEMVARYAAPDPELALRLWLWQEKEIDAQDLHQVWGLERSLTPVLIQLEREGVRVDVDRAEKSLKRILSTVKKAQLEMIRLVGKEFNANSPKQMRELFNPQKDGNGNWRVNDVLLEKTEAGAPSLNADALRALADKGDPRASAMLRVRKLTKASQFLKDHILGHQVGGRVYANYNQTKGDNDLGTGTGRFSIDDPALQQIPSRDAEIAEEVRSCFIAEEGDQWCCADWEQFEFRWFAHYAENPEILRIYAENPGADYHKVVADLTGLPRSPRFAGDPNAKQINLGLVFGMGQGKMAAEMGLPHTVRYDEERKKEWLEPGPEAIEAFDNYHAKIPGVKSLLSRASSVARSRGYVKTIFGRHIRFPNGQFTHKAGGLVFQGTSADCMKYKMVETYAEAKKLGIKMRLSVHDELNWSIPAGFAKDGGQWVKSKLETFDGERCEIKCLVPIKSSVAFGPNWYEASK